ncbi:MAG: MFS transporter [Leptospiraceae bacterium]|nr:MFS transporter [Leptospiraceae bacterium]MDW7975854.1 MFS transporter [Leptospiraceae bacterium]
MVKNTKKNLLILLLIVALDFISFTLIFPLMPDLLIFYSNTFVYDSDIKIINFFIFLSGFIPTNVHHFIQNENYVVVLMGGFFSSLFSFLQFLFSPLWGKFSDLKGRKLVLTLSSLGMAISYLIWFFSNSISFFLVSRILAGVMAGNLSVATVAISDLANHQNKTFYMGLLGMAMGIGFILGPLLGGALYYLGKHIFQLEGAHPFAVCALGAFLLSMLSVILNIFFFEETKSSLKITQESQIFLTQQKMKNKLIRYLIFLNFIYMLIFTSFEFTFTFFYKFYFHFSPETIGLIFFYLGFLLAFSQGWITKKISGKFSEKELLVLGIFMLSVSFLFLFFSVSNVYFSLIALIPLAIGNAFFQPSIASYVSQLAQMEKKGLTIGILRSTNSLSRVFGPLIGGFLFWIFGSKIYIIFSLLMVFLLLILLWTKKVFKIN